LPANARVLLGIGPLERYKGFREAVWAFDILTYIYKDLHLVLVGTGPDQSRIAHFARNIQVAGRVHFPGPCRDLAPWLDRAEIVWVPSLREAGHCAALEAMAAGRPVVASRLPGLAQVVENGVTGYLVTPNNKAELARQTRILLDDAQRRQRFGAAGRHRVEQHFSLDRLVQQMTRLYEGQEET
jgi:glycosyltransferase involved in cell wall biosynthesis